MSPTMEVLVVFISVMLAIWMGEIIPFPAWLFALPAVFFLLKYCANKKLQDLKDLLTPKKDADKNQYILLFIGFLVFWTSIVSLSVTWNSEFWEQSPIYRKFAISVLFYFGNALWQQILVNGYFLPRLEEGLGNEKYAILTLGLLFGLIHLPNPVLIPATMIGGALSAYFFKRTRNIYALIIAHSILAVSIMYFLPHSWHHHLRIGPGYFRCLK